MKRNSPLGFAGMLLGLVGMLLCALAGPLDSQTQNRHHNTLSTLDPPARVALVEALAGPDGEYAARATYAAVLARFGADVEPYANIYDAEVNHIAALQQQCVKYNVPIPPDPYLGNVTAPDTLLEAAMAGVAGELLNIEMYDRLLVDVASYPSLVKVFTNLRAASLYNHLPAFEAAVLNGGSL